MTDKVILPAESDDGFAHFTFDSESKFIRFYLWLYQAKASNINTCKLFWAFVFAPLALLVRGAVAAVGPLFEAVASRIPHKTPQQEEAAWAARREEARQKRLAKEAAGPGRLERILDKVSVFFSAAYAKVAPVLKVVAIGLGVLLGLAGVATIVYAAITAPLAVLSGFAVVLGILVFVGVVVFAINWFDKRSVAKGEVPFFSTMKRLLISFHRHTCAKVNLD